VSGLAAVEAVSATASATATTRLSGFLWLLALSGLMTRLVTVEAVSATTATTARFLGLLALARHVTGLATIEAVFAPGSTTATTCVTTSAALLAPADSDAATTHLKPIEVGDCLLSMLLVVELDEGEAGLYAQTQC